MVTDAQREERVRALRDSMIQTPLRQERLNNDLLASSSWL